MCRCSDPRCLIGNSVNCGSCFVLSGSGLVVPGSTLQTMCSDVCESVRNTAQSVVVGNAGLSALVVVAACTWRIDFSNYAVALCIFVNRRQELGYLMEQRSRTSWTRYP